MNQSIVSIIPARGGSKGIPRKNLRVLKDEPLIGHAIETSLSSELVESVVVTTEDPEIRKVGTTYGVDRVVERPARLAADDVPLAPVIEHAASVLDESFDYALCFQPTVPLVSVESLEEGIRTGVEGNYDSVVYVRDNTHNYWHHDGAEFSPLNEERKNRQQMQPIHEEIGIFLSHTDVIFDGRRIGDEPALYSVPFAEGIDIDTHHDWILAEKWCERQSLLYRVTGNERTGMGHVYRGLALAMHTTDHDVTFAISDEDDLAREMLDENNFTYECFSSDEECVTFVRHNEIDVVVNDILTTSPAYVKSLREEDVRVVNVEDVSDGSNYADAVVNALYEFSSPPDNHYYGHQYFCLRNEFRYSSPRTAIPDVDRIMISFGGVDSNDMTTRTLRAMGRIEVPLTLDVILGPGYAHADEAETAVADLPAHVETELHTRVSFMSDHMEQADLLVTSNGRTVYEATALNLPTISISQNQREQQHPFVHVSGGIRNLGLADYVSEADIALAISEYIEDSDLRERMREALANTEIENGVERVKRILFDESEGTE